MFFLQDQNEYEQDNNGEDHFQYLAVLLVWCDSNSLRNAVNKRLLKVCISSGMFLSALRLFHASTSAGFGLVFSLKTAAVTLILYFR